MQLLHLSLAIAIIFVMMIVHAPNMVTLAFSGAAGETDPTGNADILNDPDPEMIY